MKVRYSPIDPQLFIENRKRFTSKMQAGSLAVFNANDIQPTNADGTMPFRQNNDLFWLSGIDQEETILVLFPDCKDESHREVLFLRETNEHIAVWEGHKYTKPEGNATSGIRSIYWTHEFPRVFNNLMTQTDTVYLNSNEHLRATIEVETRDARFIKTCKQQYPLHNYKRSAPILHHFRALKLKQEVELIQKACDLTDMGFRRLLGFIRPGVWEYEIEAELAHEFIRQGAGFAGYEPIIATGANACILHYNVNNCQCKDGELILMDFAAGYANYQSDLTRTIPVNGKFTSRQKDVYNAVLRVMKDAKNMLVAGNLIKTYHEAVGKLMEEELIKLRLLDAAEVKKQDPSKPLYKRYFMHGTSHFLGLDVHDVGDFTVPMENGMVFTCEPGIYIPEEGIGIRIENDILISAKGPIDLMANIPIEVDEIEELMQSAAKHDLLHLQP